MDRYRIARLAAAVMLLAIGPWLGAAALSASEEPKTPGIPAEKVAGFVHAVIQADRTFYTTQVVNRMQGKGIVTAAEHWEQDNALPLPAQFLQHSGRMVAESGQGIRYRLIGLFPIYQRNAPGTDFERKALESLNRSPNAPVTGIVTSGRKRYFQAIYPDLAVSTACVSCHNSHPRSTKRDFKLNDVMGGIAITIPIE